MGTIREYKKADGSVSFHAEVRLRGQAPQRASFRTRSLAKKWIQDTESAIRDGRHFRTAESKRHTLGELIDRFIEQWLPRYPKRLAKQTALLTWWKSRIGNLLLADLTPAVIAEARDALLGQSTVRKALRSPSTVNRYLAALSKALNVGMKEFGWIDDTPMRKVTKPTEASGRNRFLSITEKDRFLEACRTSSNEHLFPIVTILMLTGMRLGEVLSLRWGDLDYQSRTITLQETKNGERRVIPLTNSVEGVLRRCEPRSPAINGLIFASVGRNNKSGVVCIRNAFLKACQQANIQNFRIHDLRHTAASYMAMNGATQGELMAVLGHKSPAMTRRYAHYSQQHLANLMQRVEGILDYQQNCSKGC